MYYSLHHTGFTAVKVLRVLKKIPIFYGLRDDEYEALLTLFQGSEYSAGSLVFREGDRGDSFYVVLSGRAEVSSEKAGLLHVVSPAEIVGEMAVVSDQPRSATVRVIEDAALMEITRERLDRLAGKAPRVSYVIMRNIAVALAERLLNANTRLKGR